jgi:hypothetical protein
MKPDNCLPEAGFRSGVKEDAYRQAPLSELASPDHGRRL